MQFAVTNWVAGITVVLLMIASGCGPRQMAKLEPPPPKVEVQHPVARPLVDEDDYNGWLRASAKVEVRARVRGHIQKIHFQDGDIVQAGQLLFELDPRPFQANVDAAEAEVKALEAQQVAAMKDLARYRELVRSGAVSQSETEKVQADAEAYAARIDAKKEEVNRYRLDLEFSRVTAPITGRVSRAELTEGNLVNAGGSDPLLTTIVANNPIYVYFSVDERSLQKYQRTMPSMQRDQVSSPLREKELPFRFGLDSEVGYPHDGVLDFADNQVETTTGTILVRGVADNKDGRLVSGSRVRVRVPVSEEYHAVLVPDLAILSDLGLRYVLIVDEQNVVSRRDIALGRLLDDGMRVVLADETGKPGVDPGEWIIVNGLQRARVNYPVDPIRPVSTQSSR